MKTMHSMMMGLQKQWFHLALFTTVVFTFFILYIYQQKEYQDPTATKTFRHLYFHFMNIQPNVNNSGVIFMNFKATIMTRQEDEEQFFLKFIIKMTLLIILSSNRERILILQSKFHPENSWCTSVILLHHNN